MVKQVALVPAGCQPWNDDVVAAQGDRFAYAATLAIYIYEFDERNNDHHLLSIMAEHKKTITSICWCPEKPDYLASSSVDGLVIVWDVVKQQIVARHVNKEPVMHIRWTQNNRQCLGFMGTTGPLWLWYIQDGKNLSMVKETQTFSSPVSRFRWHHEKYSRLAFGHQDGSISILDIGTKAQKHFLKPEPSQSGDDEDDPITTLEWDPLSQDYLLLSNREAGLRLVDISTQSIIMYFTLPSAASRVKTMDWIHNAPGMFVTGDCMGGILRVWSVSRPAPIQSMKIKSTGFHRLEVIHVTNQNNNSNSKTVGHYDWPRENNQHISATSESKPAALTASSKFSVPHAQIVCTFRDGGVGLYDLGLKRWTFLRDQSHIETIFDCKFEPDNPDLLATASFDGTIKIWDITSLSCLKSSPGNEGIIYHISWAPADLNCIAGCTSRNGAFIWDVAKEKMIKRLYNHAAKSSIYSISWNQQNSKYIMSCGQDCFCIIQQVDGTVAQRYKHPAPVFGGDWSPYNKDMLATGCEDKVVRVFYMASNSNQPIKTFSGHEAKVFHVRWNPLKEGILCSGSDDGQIRVWDYARESITAVLRGHTAPVRGLTWSSEVSALLFSGSWDYTIRVWDTRDGSCLHVAKDHGGDVYGLTSHPLRPFVLASSSRDSTLRLWSVRSLVQPVELSLLCGKPLSEVAVSSTDSSQTASLSYSLSGQAWKNLIKSNSKFSFEKCSMLFSHANGTANIWDLISVMKGKDIMMLSKGYTAGIVHRKHMTKFKASEAQQLEMIKMSRFGGGIGAPGKEERLRKAAKIHIQLGNVQRYCELMVELGEWLKALAMAPAVSVEYWQKLNKRYLSTLLEENNEDVIPHSVAAGSVDQLVNFYSARGQLTDAVLAAQSAAEGSIMKPAHSRHSGIEESNQMEAEGERLTMEAMDRLADSYLRNGSAVLAACCHLAVDDPKKAMSKLIRGHELELALTVGRVLGNCPGETDIALELLSYKCEALGKWNLGIELLRQQTSSTNHLARLCARCSAGMAETDSLLHQAGLSSLEANQRRAESLLKSPSLANDLLECVECFLLSPVPERGLRLGLDWVKESMQKSNWAASNVFPMLQLLGSIKTDHLQQPKYVQQKYELLALSAYIGALVAMQRHYYPIVKSLLLHAREMLGKERMRLPISVAQIEDEIESFNVFTNNRMTEEMKQKTSALLQKCGSGDSYWVLEEGPDYATSSHLPSHSDVHVSVLSQTRIRGQPFFLEDGKSAISQNEALMWAKVNPFSPLGSGERINPF